MTNNNVNAGSFRDPSGFIFVRDNRVYRQVNQLYRDDYDHLMSSGLYQDLVDKRLLIDHEEVGREYYQSGEAYKVIQPRPVEFISYPYEWCFSQFKDAALATLLVQKRAFEFGMTLKDSSAYNIQFHEGRAILIDTLSFERYRPGQIWYGYRQFCQHFLAPLALMSRRDVRLNQLLRVYLDGIPLDLAGRLLGRRTWLSFSLLSHIHLHSRSQKHYSDKPAVKSIKDRKMGRLGFIGLTDSLAAAVRKLHWRPEGTEWGQYYEDTNYSGVAMNRKEELVAEFLGDTDAQGVVWDVGANVGRFSRIAATAGLTTVAFDIDPGAVEKHYLLCLDKNERRILPLVLDLTNPSGGIGWQNRERQSLLDRGPAETALALALVHHLAIANNVPLVKIAEFFGRLCRRLIIEFVPKHDSQVQRLLASREDIFGDYTQSAFESAFGTFFTIQRSEAIEGSDRTLYLMSAL